MKTDMTYPTGDVAVKQLEKQSNSLTQHVLAKANYTLFKPEDFEKQKQSARPLFTITKSSIIRINKLLAEAMCLKEGDKILLAQSSGAYSNDWYVGISKEAGFTVRQSPTGEGMQFGCKGLAEMLREKFKAHKLPLRIPVSTQTTELQDGTFYALITKALEK